MTPGLATLLDRHRPRLVRWFERKGRGLARFESPEDLAQGVHLHAIHHEDRFTYQGEEAFVGWLLKLAGQHLARRIEHWTALKRDAGPMLRISFDRGIDPTARQTGPVTRAEKNEQLDVAALAMEGLPPRDRELVRLLIRDVPIDEIARGLGISKAAAQRARLRAIERFRKIYRILERQRG